MYRSTVAPVVVKEFPLYRLPGGAGADQQQSSSSSSPQQYVMNLAETLPANYQMDRLSRPLRLTRFSQWQQQQRQMQQQQLQQQLQQQQQQASSSQGTEEENKTTTTTGPRATRRRANKLKVRWYEPDTSPVTATGVSRDPFLLSDGGHTLRGKVQENGPCYVAIVNAGVANEERYYVVPIHGWFNFEPYVQPPPDKAAAAGPSRDLLRKEKTENGVLKSVLLKAESFEDTAAGDEVKERVIKKEPKEEPADAMESGGEEDWDYEEEVESDEADDVVQYDDDAAAPDTQETKGKEMDRRSRKELGKKFKKLDGKFGNFEQEDDERNPYLSDEEEAEEEEMADADGEAQGSAAMELTEPEEDHGDEEEGEEDAADEEEELEEEELDDGMKPKASSKKRKQKVKEEKQGKGGKRKMDAEQVARSKRIKQEPSAATSLITQDEVLAFIRVKPVSASEIYAKFENRFKQQPQNKGILMSILRQHVVKVTGPNGDTLLTIR